MGTLISCVKAIGETRFEAFPAGRPIKVLKVLRIADGHVYAIGPRGTVYTSGEMSRNVCYAGTSSKYEAVRALVALGIITKQDAERHGREKHAQDKMLDDYRAVTAEVEKLEEAGIRLTPKQLATLAKMKATLDVKRLPYYVQGEAKRKLGVK